METKLIKLPATPEAEQALEKMVQSTNESFSGGRIKKAQLLSWILIYFEKTYFVDLKQCIQRDHFDEMLYLESLVAEMKRARKAGGSPPDLSTLLAPLTGAQDTEK